MTGTIELILLRTIYSNSIKKIPSTSPALSRQLELPLLIIQPSISFLVAKGSIIKNDDDTYSLAPLGRKQFVVVLTGGTFDILHTGHIFTFEQAKLLGDVLVVVVATDKFVEEQKNHPPTNSQGERAKLLNHIKEVNAAIEGHETDFMWTVDFVKPDIIALGYNQFHNEKQLYKQLTSRGYGHVKIVRLKKNIPGKSTSRIVQDIIKHNYRD